MGVVFFARFPAIAFFPSPSHTMLREYFSLGSLPSLSTATILTTIVTSLVGLTATVAPAQANSVVITDGNVYVQTGRSHARRTRSNSAPVYRSPNDIPNGGSGYYPPGAYPNYPHGYRGCNSGYCSPSYRVRVRTIPFGGKNQEINNSILVNPTIINSEIRDSTLINPVIIDSSEYSNGSTRRRVYIMNGSY
jgi:hypothetical protein